MLPFTHEEHNRLITARDLALKIHADQSYGDGLPYETHLEGVVELIIQAGGNADEAVAGYLHDTWEDQWPRLVEMAKEFHGEKMNEMHTDIAVRRMYESKFGNYATQIVVDVTDDPKWANLDKLVRKTMQADKMLLKQPPSKLVKMADLTFNMRMTAAGHDKPDWGIEKRMDYIEGNQRVAYACRNVNQLLDTLFEDARRGVFKNYFGRG